MKYLTRKQLSDKLGGRSSASIYRDMDEIGFPKPIKVGGRVYGVEAEIDQFMAGLREAV